MIDLKRNSITRLGRGFQVTGGGSSFSPSPEFRYAFKKPTVSLQLPEILICDVENNMFRKERVDGWPIGWWDAQRILLKDKKNDLVLYDVETQRTSALLPLREVRKSFVEAGLTNDAGLAYPFLMWYGDQNGLYLTEGNKRWSAEESYLIKIERPGRLKLIDPHFKFEWSDHFDASGTHYLYSGRERGQTNGAVYVRDLKARTTRELIPPDLNRTNDFSLPNFYGTDVIYQRSNSLWRIRLDGSQNRRLFPPEAP